MRSETIRWMNDKKAKPVLEMLLTVCSFNLRSQTARSNSVWVEETSQNSSSKKCIWICNTVLTSRYPVCNFVVSRAQIGWAGIGPKKGTVETGNTLFLKNSTSMVKTRWRLMWFRNPDWLNNFPKVDVDQRHQKIRQLPFWRHLLKTFNSWRTLCLNWPKWPRSKISCST